MTKEQLIAETGGFKISLEEDLDFLPTKKEQDGNGNDITERRAAIKEGREQMENNQSSEEYLDILQTREPYKGEEGLIIEDWLADFLCKLETTNQVSNIWEQNNSLWLLGNYIKDFGYVPRGFWDRGNRGAGVGGGNSGARFEFLGARSLVRIHPKKF